MTVADAIAWAKRWQEEPSHDPAQFEKAAQAFSHALVYLEMERWAALDRLADAGFDRGPLGQRVEEAIAAARSRLS